MLDRGDNLEKGEDDIEMGVGEELGLPLFHYFTVQLHLLCMGGRSKVSLIIF